MRIISTGDNKRNGTIVEDKILRAKAEGNGGIELARTLNQGSVRMSTRGSGIQRKGVKGNQNECECMCVCMCVCACERIEV